jgi:hypothetical protein
MLEEVEEQKDQEDQVNLKEEMVEEEMVLMVNLFKVKLQVELLQQEQLIQGVEVEHLYQITQVIIPVLLIQEDLVL